MADELIDIVRDEGVQRLETYFSEGAFTGQWFETFQGGGDRPETRDRITLDDLYAVEALSVNVPFAVGRDLIEGDLGKEISALLREIPVDVELGTPGADERVRGAEPRSEAHQVWQKLTGQDRVNYVTAGKLLARKRPKLIPVYDSVVRCQFGAPEYVWLTLHARLIEHDGALRTALSAARDTVGVASQVSVLRALDVVLWLRHHEEHTKGKCDGFATVRLGGITPAP